MRTSKAVRAVIEAHRRGYYVDDHGIVHGMRGPRQCTIDDAGFYRFNIWARKKEGQRRRKGRPERMHVYVHKLAAFQKFGEAAIRDPHLRIWHENRDRLDNRPANIVMRTQSQIAMAMPQAARVAYAINAARKLRALSNKQLVRFRELSEAGASLKVLAKRFKIAKSTASYIRSRRTYG